MTAPSSSHRDLFELHEPTLRCPSAALDDLRQERVRFLPRLGAFVVSGYADAVQVLSDPELFSSRNPTGPHSATPLARRIQAGDVDLAGLSVADRERLEALARRRAAIGSAPALISADPPLHEHQRRAIEPAFAPDRLRALEPFVAQVVDELVTHFVDRGEVEFVSALCRPLPVRVIGHLLGLADADAERVRRWSDAFVLAVGNAALTPQQLLGMFEDIADCYDDLTTRIESGPRTDLVGVVAGQDGAGREVSLAERLQVLTQLVVAGNETTANLLASAVLRIATTSGLEDQLRTDMSRLPDFVEEVLRLETPSTGLFRQATENTRLGGVDIPTGSYVFVSYQAANRDAGAFDAPGDLHFDRPDKPQHLAFGAGVHTCPAASLARIEARIALEALLRRVRDLRLTVPLDELPYVHSFALRGPAELPLAFTRNDEDVDTVADAEHRPMLVESGQLVAERILEVVLCAPDGRELPAWEPGAHVDVVLPSGTSRQYSLCGDSADRSRYTIAVLEELDGRGGSAELHRVARAGTVLRVRPPRNNFPLAAAPKYLFLAGGIGVTPILTMVERAQRQRAEWTLVYGGRSRTTMAYLDRVASCTGGTVELWPEDERGRPDLAQLLAAQDDITLVYVCGPSGLIDAVQTAHARVRGLQPLRFERFAAAGPVDTTGGAFEVVLSKTGRTLIVEQGASILETVRTVLPRMSYSCEEGYCGECETTVLEGEPDHRDDFLDEDERAAGETMMICVSRCKSDRLVLDL